MNEGTTIEQLVDGNRIINIKFFSAGKAIFTISNPDGDHYTYKILQKKAKNEGEKQENMPFFVYLLTGPDNSNDYTYLGVYNVARNNVYVSKASSYTYETKAVKVVKWAVKMVERGNWEDPKVTGYDIVSAGKCCRCGRKLTTPESVQNGIGPECINLI